MQKTKTKYNKLDFQHSRRKNYYNWLRTIVVIIVCIFGLSYLALINSTASKGYELSRLERRIEELKRENKKLEVKITELQSLGNISKRISQLDMVPSSDISYLKSITPYVAQK